MAYPNKILLMDGTTAVKDIVSRAAFTMAGGVSNEFTTAANMTNNNFRTLLGAQAPVIAQAATNLLTYASDNSTFEQGTTGTWGAGGGITGCTVANSSADYWHGSKSLKTTVTAVTFYVRNILTAITTPGQQVTISLRFKGVVGRSYFVMVYDNVAGSTYGATVTGTGLWQTYTVTHTFGMGSTARAVFLYGDPCTVGDIIYYDAIQLETGAVATPYCIDVNDDAVTRTACTQSIANPITSAPASLFFIVNEPWNGDDGILHTLFDNDGIEIYKTAANALTLKVTDVAAGTKTMSGAVTSVNMAANTNHFIAATIAADGTLVLKLNNVALTTSGGAGTGIPANFDASAWIGTDDAGANPWNGAILPAGWGGVLTVAEITALSTITAWTALSSTNTLADIGINGIWNRSTISNSMIINGVETA